METKRNERLLVLLAGQSNMAGRGYAEPEDLIPVPGVEYIRPDLKWAPAIEPITRDRAFVGTFDEAGTKLHSSDPFETVLPEKGQIVCGVGLGRTFGKLLAEANPGKTVGLIPTAVGGTSIAAWLPGGADDWDAGNYPYDTAIRRAKEAQKSGKIVVILWHQGENDAAKQTEHYKEKLRTVAENFRKELGLDDTVPFIAGDLASFYEARIADHIGIVDQALEELEQELPWFMLVRTKDLNHRGDNIHFDTPSLHELGARYFAAYCRYSTALGIRIYAEAESEIAEGPFWSQTEQNIYWVNPSGACDGPLQGKGPVYRKEPGASSSFSSLDPGVGGVSAFSQRQDGTFLLFAQGCRVWTWKPGEKAELFAELPGHSHLKFNDVTTSPDGSVFCTVLPEDLRNGAGELWRLDPDSTFYYWDTCRGVPNGMGFSPDNKTFYFTASTESKIYRYDYANGALSGKRVFAEVGGDGLAVDSEGGVWSALWSERIVRFTPDGKISLEFRIPGMIVSSLCFGGENMRDLFITTGNYPYKPEEFFRTRAGSLFTIRNLPYTGRIIPFFKG